MDRYFYSVEMDGDRKVVHIFGNVYFNDVDEGNKQYRHAQWVGMYLSLNELYEFIVNDDLYEYINERVIYLDDIDEADAADICQLYFNGQPGTELNIKNITEDTPCGDYWFE